MKIRFVFNICFLLIAFSGFAQTPEYVIIGQDSSAEMNCPVAAVSGYSWSSIIFTKAEIARSGEIDSIFFQVRNSIVHTMFNQKVYMMETDDSVFVSTIIPDSSQMFEVLNGTVVWQGLQWSKVVLDHPFYYSGNKNLLILWKNHHGTGVVPYPEFLYTRTEPKYQVVMKHNSTFSSLFPLSYGTMVYNRPNIKLAMHSPWANNDAALHCISAPQYSPYQVAGDTIPVRVVFRNAGLYNIHSVEIHMEIDGVAQPAFQWYGNLAPDSLSPELSIGNIIFPTAGDHVLKVYVRNPNYLLDEDSNNDTIEKTYKVCNQVLSGTYTIDPLQPTGYTNFRYFAEPLAILKECGIRNPTVFNIAPGVYDTVLIFNYLINGADANNRIIFQSATQFADDVTIQHDAAGSTDNFIVLFNGARFVDFKNLTLKSLDTSFSTCLTLTGGGSDHIFENIIFEGPVTHSYNTSTALVQDGYLSKEHYISFYGNRFLNGGFSILAPNNDYNKEYGWIMDNNEFINFYVSGVSLDYFDGAIIRNNIFSTSNMYGGSIAADLSNCYYSIVEYNKFEQPFSRALYMFACDAGQNRRGRVVNNMVAIGGGATSSGIFINDSYYIDVFHNTVLFSSPDSSNGSAFYCIGCEYSDIRNNVFINDGDGYAYHNRGSNISTSDYNMLYTSGPVLVYSDYTNYATLAAWQSASYRDLHSYTMHPDFVSTTDLHIQNAWLNNLGTNIGVERDYDHQLRNLVTPALGADEFIAFNDDVCVSAIVDTAGLSMPGALVNIKTRIKNTGTSTLDSIPLMYQVAGVIMSNDLWTGTLYCDDSTEFSFVQQLPVPDDAYTLCVRSSVVSDYNPTNDEYCMDIYTGIENINSNHHFALISFPNPADNSTQIQFNLQHPALCNVIVYNLFGDIVYTYIIEGASGENTFSVNTSGLPDGVYLISVDDGSDRNTLRMVVMH
ncbi:MAG: T9SS type A sorting domain-containing protein [Bacteroidales bacterium]